jgi:2,4-dienoyl-CoA reductase-like NADH-dependent reductase (Old Yellow Enzyme family)
LGAVTDISIELYRTLGQDQIGLIVTDFAFVSSHGQSVPAQYGVHNNDMIPGLRRLVQAVHKGGGKIALQIEKKIDILATLERENDRNCIFIHLIRRMNT